MSSGPKGHRWLNAIVLAILLAACASRSEYMGISFTPGAASAELQQRAQRARSGDKQALLELGIAFEEGRGIARDCSRARKLYRLAAMTSGGTMFIYQPPTRKGGRGAMVPVNMGPRLAGIEEARRRLNKLQSNTSDCP